MVHKTTYTDSFPTQQTPSRHLQSTRSPRPYYTHLGLFQVLSILHSSGPTCQRTNVNECPHPKGVHSFLPNLGFWSKSLLSSCYSQASHSLTPPLNQQFLHKPAQVLSEVCDSNLQVRMVCFSGALRCLYRVTRMAPSSWKALSEVTHNL